MTRPSAQHATLNGSGTGPLLGWHPSMGPRPAERAPFAIAPLSDRAARIIENLDAPLATGPGRPEEHPPGMAVDEYARAVLYNSLGHYPAARVSAEHACRYDDFPLLEGALAELVEASVRTGHTDAARAATTRLSQRAKATGSPWAMGLAACSAALVAGDEGESHFRDAIAHLDGAGARVALGRTQLLYGEWLRRGGRSVDAREQLSEAHRTFLDVGLSGFAERARRELLATENLWKRSDDSRFALTSQEEQIAQLASRGATNREIGDQLFLSPRTVEWHLRKVFAKLGVRSRRELPRTLPCVTDATGSS